LYSKLHTPSIQCKIKAMKSWRVLLILAGLVLGVAAGLVYGWIIDPVEYKDTGLDTLRIDYQTDVVLMVANVYAQDHNSQAAIDRLLSLGSPDIRKSIDDSLNYATEMHFFTQDISNIIQLKKVVEMSLRQGTEEQ
jgi:hypothetical protein